MSDINYSNKTDYTKIAPTAYGVAYLRKFSDIPLAAEIFDALEKSRQLSGKAYTPGSNSKDRLAPQLEARYKLVDSLVRDSKAVQVLEVAAGIAPRGINFATEDPGLEYVQMDLAEVANDIQNILDGLDIAVPRNLAIKVGDALSLNDLEVAVSNLNIDKPIAIVNEGLMRYLTFEQKTIYAQNVHSLLSKYGGVWITPDISLRSALEREDNESAGHTESLKERTGIDVSKNVFDDEAHAMTFFQDLGFKIERHSFLEVSESLASPAKLGMSDEDVTALNEPCLAFVMTI